MNRFSSGYLLPLLAGPAVFILVLLNEPMFSGISDAAWLLSGLTAWMAIWWITESVPIPATSLLPIVVVPLLNLDSVANVTAPYADPLIFLFLGGFMLSIAMERWNLHKRIALLTMLMVGSKPSQQIAGMMLVTAFLSMWMSNTATAVMMLPIALSIIGMQDNISEKFAKAMLLSIAYAASIGGVATLIGTPPNALLAGYLRNQYQLDVGFAEWMLLGLPVAVVMLFAAWYWLTQCHFRFSHNEVQVSRQLYLDKLHALGPMQRAEKIVLAVFLLAASLWVLRPWLANLTGLPLNDTLTAIFCASLLFVIPVSIRTGQRVLVWEDCAKLPWGILILFGGGLTLAAQIQQSGLADFIASQVSTLGAINLILLIVLVTTIIIFLTEVTSNTATAAAFLPLLGPVAVSLNTSASMLVIPAAIAASCAFMMPVATPPNAIVFGSGKLKIADMAKAGFVLNLLAIIVITSAVWFISPYLFDF
ncbi:solute carrier family 13 (sodium-dependent dicarboxylate transporter), member 2/3/5 [Arsukibacterium tuosuense]|uniref:Solute carrier family 13 (Sodium-dependent dicarboxylate transporter), member 2/3/5 n=1 Tax=Arsukibacterium tuosuense TaxID=1323745 RepID=A0A285I310_9GAMM|nr:DASS family sodium-coupled anion symporter [Arsukibacterium tuosuense]SNY42365.1 solute carrier family 13 (sodium-dependent dicarboxylate transporter), member 2/3/5 [Arsukibacterium tuosuense]